MSCGAPLWIVYVVKGLLLFAGFLAICLMQKAEKDPQLNRVDARWLRNSRRISFIAVTASAWATSIALVTDAELFALLALFLSATALLVVNIVAIQNRPPNNGFHRYPLDVHALPRKSPLRHLLARFRPPGGLPK